MAIPPQLEYAIRRAIQKHGAYIDPFSLLELATLLKPLLGMPKDVLEKDEKLNYKLASVVQYLESSFRRAGLEEPEYLARSVVEEVLATCRKNC